MTIVKYSETSLSQQLNKRQKKIPRSYQEEQLQDIERKKKKREQHQTKQLKTKMSNRLLGKKSLESTHPLKKVMKS
jgi:hypothetical protein